MANIKVFIGTISNNKDRKLVRELQKAVANKAVKDAEFLNTFKPATTSEELQAYHTEYCTESIEFEALDLPDDEPANKEKEISDKIDELNVGDEAPKAKSKYSDPLNRSAPVEREYTANDGFSSGDSIPVDANAKFDEPSSFSEAFELPSLDEEGSEVSPNAKPGEKKKKPEYKPPINPAFDDMTTAKKKKQSKMFAKHVVEGVCSLAELGFVWFATKDTNDTKLIEYELNGEIDLTLLLSMEGGQEMTIKTWFQGMNLKAEQLAVIDQESKDELADALAEVLLEKGIAPTPSQTLLMVSFNVFIMDKAKALLLHKMEIGSVLKQLRSMAEQRGIPEQGQQQEAQEATIVDEIKNPAEEESTSTELTTTTE